MENNRRPFSPAIFWLGLGVVLFAVGGKLALISRYGTDQPYADQWTGEGMFLLRGPLYYQLDLNQLTASHGEHRPAMTRLWARGLILGNDGQWDCFVEVVANLLIYAAFLAVAWSWVARSTGRGGLWFAALFMAGLFALPSAYENFLWGFQSCFLFMLLLGSVHVTWTMQADRPGVRWWLAQLAGFLGLFSIAAGVMSAAALVVVAGFGLYNGQRGKSWAVATLVVNALWLGLGLWMLPEGAGHTGSSIVRLGAALVRTSYLLSWPFPDVGWGLLLQVPWVWLLITAWRGKRGGEQSAGDWRVVAVGLWMMGTSFVIGYGREVTPETIGVRYYDGLTLGLFASFLALLRIHSQQAEWRRVAWKAAFFLWLLGAGWGLANYNKPENLGNLFKYQHDLAVEQREIIRDFLKTDDPARLQEFANTSHRFTHMEYTLIFLRDPKVTSLLPPSLTPDGHAGPLSRLAGRVAVSWPLVVSAAIVLMLTGMVGLRRAAVGPPRP